MSFIQKYNQYLNKYKTVITEGSLSSIQSVVQREILIDYFDGKTYAELNEVERNVLKNEIQIRLIDIEDRVKYITDNKQYQSWLYDQIKDGNISVVYFKQMNLKENKSLFEQFTMLCRSPKLTSEQKNIQNYPDFLSFQKFINEHRELLIKNMKADFEKVYSNNSYDIYSIYYKNKQQFQQLYGPLGFNCGWCVVNSDKDMFEHYLRPIDKDHYYLWTWKNSMKPFALFHFKTGQFKDIHNAPLTREKNESNTDIIDGLIYLIKQYRSDNYQNELYGYHSIFLNQKYKNLSLAQRFAKMNGVKYDRKTNTINMGDRPFSVPLSNDFVNDQGTFDFIITSLPAIETFKNCTKLKRIPDGFTFSDLNLCFDQTFYGCENLEYIPESLQIPKYIESGLYMFSGCDKLKHIPNIFKNVFGAHPTLLNCDYMFSDCTGLVDIPEGFYIPSSVRKCTKMFYGCKSLVDVPETFTIDDTVIKCDNMFEGCTSLSEKSKKHIQKILDHWEQVNC